MVLAPELRQLRAEISELEVQLSRKRDELYELQKRRYHECEHEWIQEEKGSGMDGFWYGYCPFTCRKCGHFQGGPIKV